MMTADEVIDLLTLVAAGDKRTIGEADVEVWLGVAEDDQWTFPRARRALREHRRASREFVMPVHICERIAAARKTARSRFTEDVAPPRELADDPAGEIDWRRQRAQAWVEHALDHWADTGEIPDNLPQRVELGERQRPQLTAAVRSLARLKAVPDEPRREPADANDRAQKVAQARRELDNIRDRCEQQAPADEPPVAAP